MIEVTDSVTISRAPTEVFAFVADMSNLPKWQSEVVTSTVLTTGPTRIGTKFSENVKMGPSHVTADCEVTELVAGSMIAFKAISPRIAYQGRITVESSGGGSKVTLSGTAQMNGWWRLMQPLMKSEFRNGVRKELGALKAVLEKPSRADRPSDGGSASG